jgi:hypothetical protein
VRTEYKDVTYAPNYCFDLLRLNPVIKRKFVLFKRSPSKFVFLCGVYFERFITISKMQPCRVIHLPALKIVEATAIQQLNRNEPMAIISVAAPRKPYALVSGRPDRK